VTLSEGAACAAAALGGAGLAAAAAVAAGAAAVAASSAAASATALAGASAATAADSAARGAAASTTSAVGALGAAAGVAIGVGRTVGAADGCGEATRVEPALPAGCGDTDSIDAKPAEKSAPGIGRDRDREPVGPAAPPSLLPARRRSPRRAEAPGRRTRARAQAALAADVAMVPAAPLHARKQSWYRELCQPLLVGGTGGQRLATAAAAAGRQPGPSGAPDRGQNAAGRYQFDCVMHRPECARLYTESHR